MTRAQWTIIAILVSALIIVFYPAGVLKISATNNVAASSSTYTIYLPLVMKPLPNTIAVLGNYFSFMDTSRYWHLVGEVQNGTANNAKNISIPIRYFKGNQLVGSDSVSPWLSNLPSGCKNCFHYKTRFYTFDWDSYTLDQPVFSTNGRNFQALTTYNVTGHYICCVPYVIDGTVRNDSPSVISSAIVVGTLYGGSGNSQVIGCEQTNVGSLAVNQSVSFRLIFQGPDYSGGAVKRFVVQADSSN